MLKLFKSQNAKILLLLALIIVLAPPVIYNITTSTKPLEASSPCTDTDGGKNFHVKGTVTESDGQIWADYCRSNNGNIVETICALEVVNFIEYTCPNGCEDGACILSGECSDSDAGTDYYTKGSAIGENGEQVDSCKNENVLIENYCEGLNVNSEERNCPNGCLNGECVQEEGTCTDTDDGSNYYIKGFVAESDGQLWMDRCRTDNGNLVENTCNGDLVYFQSYTCPNGCLDGACISLTPSCSEDWTCGDWSGCENSLQTRTCNDANNCGTTILRPDISQDCIECVDSDGGNVHEIKGTISGYYPLEYTEKTFTDYCRSVYTDGSDPNWLQEYFCYNPGSYSTGYPYITQGSYYCDNGCQDGACIEDATNNSTDDNTDTATSTDDQLNNDTNDDSDTATSSDEQTNDNTDDNSSATGNTNSQNNTSNSDTTTNSDEQINDDIDDDINTATSTDNQINDNTNDDSDTATSSDEQINDDIDDDINTATSIDEQINLINNKANYLFEDKISQLLDEIDELRSIVKEQETKINYLEELKEGFYVLDEKAENAINNFITYGVDNNTKKLGAGERAAVIYSYKQAFNKLPELEEELTDVIKIANGRWPSETSKEAEDRAKEFFKKIYLREVDINSPNDNAALIVMTYGLRQNAENRNLESEKAGLRIFGSIYSYLPSTTEDWNIMQAITYSGASR